MKSLVSKFQIGKKGLTEGVIKSLNSALKNHKQIRASVLKSFGRDHEKMKEFVALMEKNINYRCRYKIIGFTIVVLKRSKQIKR